MGKTIRIAGTEFSLKRRAYEIFIQGCNRKCPGCHNPTTHSFESGKVVDIQDFFKDLAKKLEPFIKAGLIQKIFVSGGDLMCWDKDTIQAFGNELTKYFYELELWLFTGAEEEELPNWIWWYFNIIKVGRYREDLRNPEGTFPASSNQKLLFFYKLPDAKMKETEFDGIKKWG